LADPVFLEPIRNGVAYRGSRPTIRGELR
jgi:hypothetical protein